ncbi:MAG: hypothetical protein AAGJ82_14205, partial [Bacteroidota bacterium]
ITPSRAPTSISLVLVNGAMITCALGIITALVGMIRKENWTWYKWLGLIFNFLLFSVMIGCVLLYSYS